MNMSKRELRLALQEKLEQRRDLLRQNSNLRSNVRREEDRNNFLLKTLANPMVNMALEDCADEIIQKIIEKAIKASKVVADQTINDGDYEIGIDIEPLHIRMRLLRNDLDLYNGEALRDRPIRRVSYQSN